MPALRLGRAFVLVLAVLVVTALALGACQTPGADVSGAAPAADAERSGTANAEAEHADPEHAEADSTAHAVLPIREVMQVLSANLAGFTSAMWVQDYGQMTVYADGVADHPHIAPADMQRIRAELGDETAAFETADEVVHEAAVRLHAAAEARDLDASLSRLEDVQAGCVSCHVRFQRRLRTPTAAAN